jgi:hypothetical protein
MTVHDWVLVYLVAALATVLVAVAVDVVRLIVRDRREKRSDRREP